MMDRVYEEVCHLHQADKESICRVSPNLHYHIVVKDQIKLLVPLMGYYITRLLNTENMGINDEGELDLLTVNLDTALARKSGFRLESLFHKLNGDGSQCDDVGKIGSHWSLSLYLPLARGSSAFVNKRLGKVMTLYSNQCNEETESMVLSWLKRGLTLDALVKHTDKNNGTIKVQIPDDIYSSIYNTRISDTGIVKVIRKRCENFMRQSFVYDGFASCEDMVECVPGSSLHVAFLRMLFYSNADWDRLMLQINLRLFIEVKCIESLDELLSKASSTSTLCKEFFAFQKQRMDTKSRFLDTINETIDLMKKQLRYIGCYELKRLIIDFLSYMNDTETFPLKTENDMDVFTKANMTIRKDLVENLSIDVLLPKVLDRKSVV